MDPFGGGLGMGGMPHGGMGMGGMPGMGGMGGMPGYGGMPTHPPRPKRFDAIPNGTIVSLVGLRNRSDRNGDRGEIEDYDPSSGRYTVLIEDSDERLKVKPSNLLQHIHVTLQSIASQPDLNGTKGTIIRFDEQKQRYNIYVMDRSKVVSLKPGNVILDNGTVAKIIGLLAKPELNGKYGTIKQWVPDSNRYDVQLSADQIIRVKTENVRV
jgi:hypothetical protein